MNDAGKTDDDQKKNVDSYFSSSRSWQGGLYKDETDYFARAVRRRLAYSMQMVEGLALPPGSKVLDVGCGAGAYVEQLYRMGYDVTGVDLTVEMLEATRNRLGASADESDRLHLRQGDVENIPFPDESFDLVICVGVLSYLRSDEKAHAEMRRVLRPGGHLILAVRNIYCLTDIDFLFRQKLKATFRDKALQTHLAACPDYAFPTEWVAKERQYSFKAYKIRKYERVMKDAGFKRKRSMTYGFEFRRLRKLKIIPVSVLDGTERFLEGFIHKYRLPYLSYSGWIYSGLFIKG